MVIELSAESSKTVLTKFEPRAAHTREQGDLSPVGRDQDSR